MNSKRTTKYLVDRDGTLFDTCRLNTDSYFIAGKSLQIDFDYMKLSLLIHQGASFRELLDACQRSPTAEQALELHSRKKDTFLASISKARLNERIFDEIRECQYAIVSNSSIESTRALLDNFKITLPTSNIFGPNGATRPKPSPDLYLGALASLKWHDRETLALEDSIHGVASASAAGLPVRLVEHFCSLDFKLE